tara:strand:- start:310 stop:519 length:210 start_codon:yes stop_codon:yes gene_type:complete
MPSEKNKKQIHEWLDNFHNNIDSYLDPDKQYNIKDILLKMPEECGREYLRAGNMTFGTKALYDQIMKGS